MRVVYIYIYLLSGSPNGMMFETVSSEVWDPDLLPFEPRMEMEVSVVRNFNVAYNSGPGPPDPAVSEWRLSFPRKFAEIWRLQREN